MININYYIFIKINKKKRNEEFGIKKKGKNFVKLGCGIQRKRKQANTMAVL